MEQKIKNKSESLLLHELIYISLEYPAHQRKDLINKWLEEGYDPNIDWEEIEAKDIHNSEYTKKYVKNKELRNQYSLLKDEFGFYDLNCIVCGEGVKRLKYYTTVKCNKSACRSKKTPAKPKPKKDNSFECNCSTCNTPLTRVRKCKRYACDECRKKDKNNKELTRYYYLNNSKRIHKLKFYNEETKMFECPCTGCNAIVNRKTFRDVVKCDDCKKEYDKEHSKNYKLSEEQILRKIEYQKKYQAEYRIKNPRRKNAINNTNTDNSLHS